mgnify:CR=1 FL=1
MNILSKKNICLTSKATTQKEMFTDIAKLAVSNGYATDISLIEKGLVKRESEGTTGMMDGIAIPHCQSENITSPGVFIFKSQHPIEWQAMDEKPVHFIVSLLIPKDEAGTTHLKILSTIARMLMKEDVKNELLNASDEVTILSILETNLKGV